MSVNEMRIIYDRGVAQLLHKKRKKNEMNSIWSWFHINIARTQVFGCISGPLSTLHTNSTLCAIMFPPRCTHAAIHVLNVQRINFVAHLFTFLSLFLFTRAEGEKEI